MTIETLDYLDNPHEYFLQSKKKKQNEKKFQFNMRQNNNAINHRTVTHIEIGKMPIHVLSLSITTKEFATDFGLNLFRPLSRNQQQKQTKQFVLPFTAPSKSIRQVNQIPFRTKQFPKKKKNTKKKWCTKCIMHATLYTERPMNICRCVKNAMISRI